jgi:glycosyltransferase involved in cell wall biosynthesis
MLVDRSSPAFLEAALQGLAETCRRDPRVLAFINTERATGHAVWKIIRRLALADRVSLIPDAESRRETVLRLDGLIIAEPGGRLRSMALDAMATGMPVIAAADASLGVLHDGVNARLVTRPDSADWAAAIGSIVTGSDEVQRLRRSASAWVLEHRAASAYISSVLRVYDSIVRSRADAQTAATAA